MDLIEIVRESWSFTGLDPVRIVEANAFGNVIVEAADGRYWRICPEELSCEPIASSAEEFEELRPSAEFELDWQMARLVDVAESQLELPSEERCYCLKVPAVLGGAYAEDNLAMITRAELLASSGVIASQIKDLPNGTKVRLRIV
jgi:hypothetical protein